MPDHPPVITGPGGEYRRAWPESGPAIKSGDLVYVTRSGVMQRDGLLPAGSRLSIADGCYVVERVDGLTVTLTTGERVPLDRVSTQIPC